VQPRVRGGLTSDQAAALLREVGANHPPEPHRRSTAARVGDQLRDPMILLLQGAAVLSALLRDWSSTAIIATVVVFNTTVGVLQQHRADRVMAELGRLSAPTALARRDGVLATVPASQLVPGDEVVLASGDVVPADGVVVEAHDLEVDESPVTGESLPVPRREDEELLAATRVTRGRGVVVLTRTGAASSLGRIASLIVGVGARPTPLQRRLTRLSRTLVVLVVALTVVVVGLGVAQGRPWGEMVLVGLSLTVAAVPESLPAVVTIALALGAHRMAQRHVVVRALPAVETLGSVTVVATDKTGTITEGRMSAQALWVAGERLEVAGSGYAPAGEVRAGDGAPPADPVALGRLLRDVVLCNDADLVCDDDGEWSVVGDTLEGALLALAGRGGVDAYTVRSQWPRTGEDPFDHATRAMTSRHRGVEGQTLWVRKGAPEVVLRAVGGPQAPPGQAQEQVLAVAGALAGAGLRVIAVADSTDGRAWRLVGLVGIGDAPRAAAREVVATLRRAGIRLVLVTGDHAGTAGAVAEQVGIAGPGEAAPVEGHELAAVPPDVRRARTVVARVVPEQKVHVVEWLQEAGEVVAMLGDGVNDAPALRRADIGVAAGRSGSEVAKEAADLVLTDDELGSVVAAVEEGRRIYANIRAFLLYAVSGGLAEVGVMVAGSLVGLAVPLLPGQILWINLLTHGLVGVAFGSEPIDDREMTLPPRPPTEPVFTRPALVRLAWVTLALVVAALAAGALTSGADDVRRTAIFAALGVGQLGVALALRARRGRPAGAERGGHGVDLAVLLALALLAAAVWVPPLRGLVHTAAIDLRTTLVALAAGVVPGAMLQLARGRVDEGGRSARADQ
jgi:P-type Ca2+ transporter type 2C